MNFAYPAAAIGVFVAVMINGDLLAWAIWGATIGAAVNLISLSLSDPGMTTNAWRFAKRRQPIGSRARP